MGDLGSGEAGGNRHEAPEKTRRRPGLHQSTKPHIVIVGHITLDELTRELDDSTAANGFANRFIWVVVKRSKELPRPEVVRDETIRELRTKVQRAVSMASEIGEVDFDAAANDMWHSMYNELSAERDGLTGQVTGRGEAHVMRLAMLEALMDGSGVIRVPHLKAAKALWAYSLASVEYIFGDSSGDPKADVILRELETRGRMTRTEISKFFGNHDSSAVSDALERLRLAGRVRLERETGTSAVVRSIGGAACNRRAVSHFSVFSHRGRGCKRDSADEQARKKERKHLSLSWLNQVLTSRLPSSVLQRKKRIML